MLSSLIQASALPDDGDSCTETETRRRSRSTTSSGAASPAFGVAGLLSFIAGTVATGACFKAIADGYLGERAEWRPALGYAARRLHSILWVTFLGGSSRRPRPHPPDRPGRLPLHRFAVAVPVLLTEGLKGRQALGRSRRLVKGRWWGDLRRRRPRRDPRRHRRGSARRARRRVASSTRPTRRSPRSSSTTIATVLAQPDRDAAHGRLRHRSLLRPARAQGGVRPAAARGADRRRPGAGAVAGGPLPREEQAPATEELDDDDQPPYWPPPPGWKPRSAAGRRRMRAARGRARGAARCSARACRVGRATRRRPRCASSAARAASDPAALAQLREIDRVDGAPVDLARRARRRARARSSSAPRGARRRRRAPVATSPAARSRRGGRDPGAGRSTSRPGRRARSAACSTGSATGSSRSGGRSSWLAEPDPGRRASRSGRSSARSSCSRAAFVAVRLGAPAAAASSSSGSAGRAAERAIDPRELEQLADEAEDARRARAALRLRFRAGLVRLAALRAVPQPETLTSRQLVRAARLARSSAGSPAISTRSSTAAGRPPRADVETAREGWPQVLREARAP